MTPGALTAREVARRVRAAQAWAWFYGVLGFLGPALLVFSLGVSLATVAPGAWAGDWRRVWWCAAAGAAVAVARRVSGPWRGDARSVARALGGRVSDEWLTAWELARTETPFTRRLRARLPRPAARGRLRPRGFAARLAAAALGAGILLVLSRTDAGLWPFGPERLPGLVSLTPGNARFPRGETVTVHAEFREAPGATPRLWVKAGAAPWTSRPLEAADSLGYRITLQGLREETVYRLSVGRGRTARYALIPFDPPRLASFRAEVRPPAYTGRGVERAENPFAPGALLGSTLTFSGEWESSAADVRVSDETGAFLSPSVEGRGFRWRWVVRGDARLRLWAAGPSAPWDHAGGSPPVSVADITVSASADRPPEVHWLSPAGDATVSPTEEIPVTYEAVDDVGLREVRLVWSVSDAPARSAVWRRFGSSETMPLTVDRSWPLAPLGLGDGDRLEARLVARDRRGGEGSSALRRFFIVSPTAAHAKIQEDLERFHDALVARSAEQEALGNMPDHAEAARRETRLGEALSADARALESLLARMAADPLTDEASLSDHREVGESLAALSRRDVPAAAEALARGDASGAAGVERELRRLADGAGRALQAQNTRRLLEDQVDLTRQAESLAEALGAGLGDAARADMDRALARMQETLQRIADRIRNLPQSLPQDFARRAGTLRFDEVQSSLDALRAALSRGDGAGALAAARRLAAQLSAMENALAGAGRAALGADVSGVALESDLARGKERVDDLIRRQEDLLARTRAVQSRVWEVHLARQDQFLRDLSGRLKEWGTRLESLSRDAAWGETGEGPDVEMVTDLLVARARWGEAGRAFAAGASGTALVKVRDSAAALRSLIARLDRAATPGTEKKYNKRASWRAGLASLADEMDGAAGHLSGAAAEDAPLSAEDAVALDRAAGEERGLSEDTRVSAREMGESGALEEAARAMDDATEALVSRRPGRAVERQEAALERLRERADRLSRAAQSRTRRRGGGSFLYRGGPASGGGPVRIPGAGEFLPPAAFREELSESMKESYPKNYEKIIENYLRHWSK